MYTLEKHLKFLSEENSCYEQLYSVWTLNYQNLSKGLSVISSLYPHYSSHDVSHSMSIVENIQYFLGEDRIKKLGATDTFMLLMSCLTHDIGMILSYKIIEKEWKSDGFWNIINEFSLSGDEVIAKAAKLLIDFKFKERTENDYSWALEVKNAVTLLTAEIFRPKHSSLSSQYIEYDSEFNRLASNFHFELLSNRFLDLLAKVAQLHGSNFEDVMSLYYQANGIGGDFVHPRFISCMIRLGDLLDLDSKRFNTYSIATVEEMPQISQTHFDKHESVTHFLVSPTGIEAEWNCNDEKIFRSARQWLDWLDDEVNKQSREWSKIAPADLGGLPPVLSKDGVKILYKGTQTKTELLNLKFSMSQEKIFNLLQGGGIYKEPGFVFIREIVQNAIDASKLQMWCDIKAGLHDALFISDGKDPKVESIKFPDDIPVSVYKQYPIALKIRWKDDEKTVLRFECEDCGIGVSEDTLLRMTQKVGDSHKNDIAYKELCKDMPYWLKPTAFFGIGIQSVFFVAPSFQMETLSTGEKAKRITFRSPADNQYCSFEYIDKKRRGTNVIVDVKCDSFKELFGNSYNMLDSRYASLDIYKEKGDSLFYLIKIDGFIGDSFSAMDHIALNYRNECLDNTGYECPELCPTKNKYEKSSNDNCRIKTRYQSNFLAFDIIENKFGSSFSEILFDDSFMENRKFSQYISLRNIPIKNAKFNSNKTSYLGFHLNLDNYESDEIVDISRDNLTKKGRKKLGKMLLEDLFPMILPLLNDLFKNEMKNTDESNTDESNTDESNTDKYSGLIYQYFSYCLTCLSFNITIDFDDKLSSINLPSKYATKENGYVSMFDFLTSKNFVFVDTQDCSQFKLDSFIEEYEDLKDKIFVFSSDLIYYILSNRFVISSIMKQGNVSVYSMYLLEEPVKTANIVKCQDPKYLLKLEKRNFDCHSRNIIYGIDEYKKIIIWNYSFSEFDTFLNYSLCRIISPFPRYSDAINLVNGVKDKSEEDRLAAIKTYITENLSLDFIEFIKKNNINKDSVTEQEIIDTYIKLIQDYLNIKLLN